MVIFIQYFGIIRSLPAPSNKSYNLSQKNKQFFVFLLFQSFDTAAGRQMQLWSGVSLSAFLKIAIDNLLNLMVAIISTSSGFIVRTINILT